MYFEFATLERSVLFLQGESMHRKIAPSSVDKLSGGSCIFKWFFLQKILQGHRKPEN